MGLLMGEGESPSKWGLIRPFVLILLIHSLAIYLFTRGFLLTRTELSSHSHCSDVSQSPCNISSHPDRCWTPPSSDRVIIIVLDAIRFDFVAPSTFFPEKKPWMDRLPVLQKLASDKAASARIFKAIADPPTTSLQRLKGLTTGGLPTFIDVGNSFGAPAITEDNLINQLVKNGKRVLMMGDDTWLQLFPDHFEKSYPYPSFNVKDLHTVDNGAIEHLLPSLNKEGWDVLVAHFLGVDHAGHIFGVDSTPMIQKLEQYNGMLEEIVEILKNQSGSGGLHENTLLLVMGDHGQTLNGDHGGGTPEEVETSLFAMSFSSPPSSISSILDTKNCKPNLNGEMLCVSIMQQLDFAVTMAAILGIPFPFGSIGRINPELYALSSGTWGAQRISDGHCKSRSNLDEWMQNYVNALCINCWQVKKYIDLYSATSVIGFPTEDLQHITDMYTQAQANWSNALKTGCLSEHDAPNEFQDSSARIFQRQIDAYSNFLGSVAKIARSAWTEFNLLLMGVGFSLMLASLFIQIYTISRVNSLLQFCYHVPASSGISFRLVSAFLLVAIHGASLLSNSYILAEGNVVNFLLATSGILSLRCSISKGRFFIEEYLFLILNFIVRFGIEYGTSKQTNSSSLSIHSLSIFSVVQAHPVYIVSLEIFPIFLLSLIAFFLYKRTSGISCWTYFEYFLFMGTIVSYVLIVVHWASESNLMGSFPVVQNFGRIFAPRMVYAIGVGLLVLLAVMKTFDPKGESLNSTDRLPIATVAMLSAWSSSILILLGRQGPFVALICISGAWCIIRLQKVAQISSTGGACGGVFMDPISVTQWSLLAACLFFYTGHWCAFDGLRYGAAFIGFDHFNIIRQGLLLAVDTFGVSHILPILSLPFLVTQQYQFTGKNRVKDAHFMNLAQVFLSYGLITTVTTTFTILCVTIQRRHLMVWGLFAPKYVFDVLGLILSDILICVASLYYF